MDLHDLIMAVFQKHGIENVYVKNDGDNLVLGWDAHDGPRMLSLKPGLTSSEIENEIESALAGWFRVKGGRKT